MLILVTEAKLTPSKTFPQNSNELFLNIRGESKFWNIFGEVAESVFPGNFWSNSITMVKSVGLAPALISCCRYDESPHAQRFTTIQIPCLVPLYFKCLKWVWDEIKVPAELDSLDRLGRIRSGFCAAHIPWHTFPSLSKANRRASLQPLLPSASLSLSRCPSFFYENSWLHPDNSG